MAYFRHGSFSDDPWAERTIVDGADWQDLLDGPLPSPLGLSLQPGFAVSQLAEHVGRIELIKIAFPKFTDGRGYSMGWILRSRLGFTGEMRATGDILFDEMQLMARCGFDGYEIVDEPTLQLLRDGRRAAAFDRFYQPGLEPEIPAGTRPWLRRSAPV